MLKNQIGVFHTVQYSHKQQLVNTVCGLVSPASEMISVSIKRDDNRPKK